MRDGWQRRLLLALLLLAPAAVTACAPGAQNASVTPLSSPAIVLDTYLRMLVAGDCNAGRRLASATFGKGNGELCGATQVSAFVIDPGPARPSSNEVVFAARITTSGTADGSVPAGEVTWFYSLDRRLDGSWRIVGGGSGP